MERRAARLRAALERGLLARLREPGTIAKFGTAGPLGSSLQGQLQRSSSNLR